jgi:hypothetical protein
VIPAEKLIFRDHEPREFLVQLWSTPKTMMAPFAWLTFREVIEKAGPESRRFPGVCGHLCSAENSWALFREHVNAGGRAIQPRHPESSLIEKMIVGGDLVTVSALGPDGAIIAVNLIYLCPPYAFDLYGASGENRITGSGQFLRWECTRWVKSHGLTWYDLGGVATTEASNPIYAFKRTLGGKYVDLGSEYRRVMPLTGKLYACLRHAKILTRPRLGF